MVWSACTFVNVNELIAPCDTPSTSTFAMLKQVLGVIVNVWFAPCVTDTAPLGLIEPPAPAEAVIVNAPLGESFAHQVLHLLELEPVLPSSVPGRVFAYSCTVHNERSSDGSTCAVLKSPQRLRPVVVLKVLW